jgi:hypothetical protein
MTKTEAERARRELQHALDALGDGAGAEEWGTGSVAERLNARAWDALTVAQHKPVALASHAFVTAAYVSVKLRTRTRDQVISCMRKVAPVLLEVLIEADDDCPTCLERPCRPLCGSQLR